MRLLRILGLVFILTGAAACSLPDSGSDTPQNTPSTESAVPTVASVEMIATHTFLTENAPPPGFGEVHFAPLDKNLSRRPGWIVSMTGHFTGIYEDTREPAEGTFEAQVQADVLGERRWVVLQIDGNALLPEEESLRLESVKMSNDYFLVDTNGNCTAGGEEISVVADLSAEELIGGIAAAVPTGHRNVLDGIPVWQYTFATEDIILPTTSLKLAPDSRVIVEADLWVSPDYDIVLRYEMTLQVQNVLVLSGTRQVSGTFYLRYEVDIPSLDLIPNISIPRGC